MLKIVLILAFTTLVSCASRKGDVVRIESQIQAEDAKSFDNIRSHFQQVLDAHPELNEEAKSLISLFLNQVIVRQKKLKDEESKVIQLLLRKSLTVAQLTKQDIRDKESLKGRLTAIYDSKADNILSLITNIKEVTARSEVDESFENDVGRSMRDFK